MTALAFNIWDRLHWYCHNSYSFRSMINKQPTASDWRSAFINSEFEFRIRKNTFWRIIISNRPKTSSGHFQINQIRWLHPHMVPFTYSFINNTVNFKLDYKNVFQTSILDHVHTKITRLGRIRIQLNRLSVLIFAESHSHTDFRCDVDISIG